MMIGTGPVTLISFSNKIEISFLSSTENSQAKNDSMSTYMYNGNLSKHVNQIFADNLITLSNFFFINQVFGTVKFQKMG